MVDLRNHWYNAMIETKREDIEIAIQLVQGVAWEHHPNIVTATAFSMREHILRHSENPHNQEYHDKAPPVKDRMTPRGEASNPPEEREDLVEEATNSMMANWPGTSGYLDALEITGEEAAELRASLPPPPPPQEIDGFYGHFKEDLINSDSE